ncbi:hypothetical protein LPJ53_006633, partial [Coemansia erecta]
KLELAFDRPFSVHRHQSNRTNIRYESVSCKDKDDALGRLSSDVARLISRDELCGTSARIIVYCTYVYQCEIVASAIQNRLRSKPLVYNGKLDAVGKSKAYSQWTDPANKNPIIVATSGFGAGIDMPSVAAVFHYGPAYNELQYAQESGRAGRMPGSVCLSRSYYWMDILTQLHRHTSEAGKGDALERLEGAFSIMQTEECSRRILGDLLDGNGLACFMLAGDGVVPCSCCVKDYEVDYSWIPALPAPVQVQDDMDISEDEGPARDLLNFDQSPPSSIGYCEDSDNSKDSDDSNDSDDSDDGLYMLPPQEQTSLLPALGQARMPAPLL